MNSLKKIQNPRFTNSAFVLAIVAFLGSVAALVFVRNYQNRTLNWVPVPFEIVSSDIAHSRQRQFGKIWTAKVSYSFRGKTYSKSIVDLPLGAELIYVDPQDPNRVVGEKGTTLRGIFFPTIAVVASGLFFVVLCLIKFSPADD